MNRLAAAVAVAAALWPEPVRQAIDLLPPAVAQHVEGRVVVLQPKTKWAPANITAWVKEGDPAIYVSGWSDNYKKALKGDKVAIIKLAAQLAHEVWHQQHGTDEAGAYDEQIRILTLLGAPHGAIKHCLQTKKDVLADPLLNAMAR